MSKTRAEAKGILEQMRCSTMCQYYCNGNCPRHPADPEICGHGSSLAELYPDDLEYLIELYTE